MKPARFSGDVWKLQTLARAVGRQRYLSNMD